MNKTYIKKENEKAVWFFVDAKDKTLGRLSAHIAKILRGKNKNDYTPYQINSSNIIVINAKYIKISGQKKYQKTYYKHSGKPGGLKKEQFYQLQHRLPCKIIEQAVKGMLPKNTLGRKLFTKLKVYAGANHPHQAQQPNPLPVK